MLFKTIEGGTSVCLEEILRNYFCKAVYVPIIQICEVGGFCIQMIQNICSPFRLTKWVITPGFALI
jgi:hypothetical protein